jgi:intracellular multiplication protein IcmD
VKKQKYLLSDYDSFFWSLFIIALVLFCGNAMATTGDIGNMASQISSTFSKLSKAITGGSYVAGLAFSIGAIMKFKQHKDNPTQITIGTPISLVFIAAALLFLPTVLDVAGQTMFTGGGSSAGPGGISGLS